MSRRSWGIEVDKRKEERDAREGEDEEPLVRRHSSSAVSCRGPCPCMHGISPSRFRVFVVSRYWWILRILGRQR